MVIRFSPRNRQQLAAALASKAKPEGLTAQRWQQITTGRAAFLRWSEFDILFTAYRAEVLSLSPKETNQ